MKKRVLVVGGTGGLGRHFVDTLLRTGHVVVVLVNSETRQCHGDRQEVLNRFAAAGAEFAEGSLENEDALFAACRGADAVISCVDHRPGILLAQANLVRAAARAGSVARIMPSQFGIDSRLYGQAQVDHGDAKRQVQASIMQFGVPVTFVHTNGLAREWVGSLGQLGLREPPWDEVEVYGDGQTRFSTVAAEDVTRYAVRALFDDRMADRHVTIIPADNLLSQSELIGLWEAKTGRTLIRRPVRSAQLDARIQSLAANTASRPQLAMAQLVRAAWIDGLGDGRMLPDAIGLADAYPDIDYVTASTFLNRYLAKVVVGADGPSARTSRLPG